MLLNRLPTPATPFIGRAEELAEIAALLSDPACRLLTIVGAGGIGKTRLAIEAARRFDGAQFVPLQPLTSSDFIVSAIADALGFQFYSSSDPQQQLLDYLREKAWLLLLDNFEHLLDGATLISEILIAAPAMRLLVTSRERLNLVEEWVLEVDGLPYPSNENDTQADEYSAVELFVQQARRAKTSFRLTDTNRSSIVRICRLVDGMPLAIELAASWVRVLSCDALASEIKRSLDILETPARNVESRHRTIRAAFAPTWNRLSEDEQNGFMKLSVFRGGFTREAAEQVVGASLRTLSALVDKSLLRVDANGRYDLQELLRQFAADKLEQSDEFAATAHRHLRYFMNWAEYAETYDYGPDQTVWYDRLALELDNLRSALLTAVVDQKAEEGLRLAGALAWFWESRFLNLEGIEWSARLLALEQPVRASVRAKALSRVGELGMGSDNLLPHAYLQEALTLAQTENDPWNVAWALAGQGCYLLHQEKFSEAIPVLDESLGLFRKLDDHLGMSHVLRRYASGSILLKDYSHAAALLEESLTSAQEAGAISPAASTLYHLARLARLQNDDFDLSAARLQKGMALCRENKDVSTLIVILKDLGSVEHHRGNDVAAVKHYEEALVLMQDFGRYTRNEGAECLAGLGNIAAAHGKSERAVRLLATTEAYRDGSFAFVKFDQQVESQRVRLGEAAFNEAWAFGKAMTAEESLADALQTAEFMLERLPTAQQNRNSLSPEPLSARELEVLRLMADGLSNAEIAQKLVIAVETVKVHARNIYSKLGVRGRTQAVIQAQTLKLP